MDSVSSLLSTIFAIFQKYCNILLFCFLTPGWVWSTAMSLSVCLYVCTSVSVLSHIWKTMCPNVRQCNTWCTSVQILWMRSTHIFTLAQLTYRQHQPDDAMSGQVHQVATMHARGGEVCYPQLSCCCFAKNMSFIDCLQNDIADISNCS